MPLFIIELWYLSLFDLINVVVFYSSIHIKEVCSSVFYVF